MSGLAVLADTEIVRIGDVAEQVRGVSYSKADVRTAPQPGYIPLLRGGNVREHGLVFEDLQFVPHGRVSPKQILRAGDIVVVASSGSLSGVGKAAGVPSGFHGTFGAFCKVIRPTDKVDASYLGHYFRTGDYRSKVSSMAGGANINNLRNEHLDGLTIRLPALHEQRRIAAILNKADELRTKRRQALAHLDQLRQSIFLSLFGDPAQNPFDWPTRPLGDLATKFSDGPFGSNLKSAHYTDQGVQVIRLQNIGVGEFVDDNRSFISEQHFESLRKHECLPGDVIVGTLGEPNLRSFVQPPSLERALNKADCVQIRPDTRLATSAYLDGLINTKSANQMAASLVLGQTRGRISMGRLRELEVPVPPIDLQVQFGKRLSAVMKLKARHRAQLVELDALFVAIQHRAFKGELW